MVTRQASSRNGQNQKGEGSTVGGTGGRGEGTKLEVAGGKKGLPKGAKAQARGVKRYGKGLRPGEGGSMGVPQEVENPQHLVNQCGVNRVRGK